MQVSITDVTADTKMFSLMGPDSGSVLEGLGAPAPAANQVSLMGFQNSPVVVAAGGGLSGLGYILISDELAAGELWRSLTIKAGSPIRHTCSSTLRHAADRESITQSPYALVGCFI